MGRSHLLPVCTFVVLSACGGGGDTGSSQYLGDKPAGVCRSNAVPEAPAYDPAAAIRPLVVMEGDGTTFAQSFLDYPAEWAATIGTAENAQVVACVQKTSETRAEVCTGYEDEGQEPLTVTVYDAEYSVKVYEASTAKERAGETIAVPSEGCPLVVSFSEGQTNQTWYESVVPQVTEIVKPYVTG